MSIPQNTPKQVMKLRVLLRVIVTHISAHLSESNRCIIRLFLEGYSERMASIALIFVAFRAGK